MGTPTASTASPNVLLALWMNGVFGQEVVEGVHEWLAENGRTWRIRFSDSGALYVSSGRWMMRKGLLDGVITYYSDLIPDDDGRRGRIPIVVLSQTLKTPSFSKRFRGLRVARVEMDLEEVAREAVDHFLSRAGFRSAGFAESYFDHGWSRLRGDAVVAEFARRGIRAERFLHYGEPASAVSPSGPDFNGLAAWLRALPKPAAVAAASDATADDIIRICEAEGIAVPRDVAVLGMDDNPVFCRHSEPNISSIHFDGRRAGRLCAEALSAMMDGRPPPPREALRYGVASVALRASTGAVSTSGALVQKALDFIDANACRGISATDVARHCGVSRSLLMLRFRELRGETVASAIRARRFAEARRLLADPDFPVEEVIHASGFGSPGALRRVFIAETGMTPGAWRGQHATGSVESANANGGIDARASVRRDLARSPCTTRRRREGRR